MATEDLLTIAGLAIVTGIIAEVVKHAWKPTPDQLDRFGPLLSLGIALVLGLPAALYLGADPIQAVLTAILAGASASGLYDTVSSQT